MLIYLDLNVYCRDYDDQTQLKIKRECKAIENIFNLVRNGKYKLCGSFILDKENNDDTLDFRRIEVKVLLSKCSEYVGADVNILNIATEIQKNSNAKPDDSLHLACAVFKKCDYFITCDSNFLKTIKSNYDKLQHTIGSIQIINPIDFKEKEVLNNDTDQEKL